MSLSSEFQFSQASLQAFVDCPRRFQLRYVLEVAWPAVAAEPIAAQERRAQLGMAFHRMVQQHCLGLPEDRLSAVAVDADLARWWQNYRLYRPAEVPGARYPEVTLAATVAEHRLIAKYDLLVVQPGASACIFDWKTSRKRTRSVWLQQHLQTRVYRYLLTRAGAYLNEGQAILPERVMMVYWFAEFPESPERLSYGPAQYEEDGRYLAALIAHIVALSDDDFMLTDDERRCQYCPYRSYCDRGVEAGNVDALEDELEPELLTDSQFDFEQIAEIAF